MHLLICVCVCVLCFFFFVVYVLLLRLCFAQMARKQELQGILNENPNFFADQASKIVDLQRELDKLRIA